VIRTGSPSTAEYPRNIGAEPVLYGDGLVHQVRDLAAGRVTAALDLHGTDTVAVVRGPDVADRRIGTIAAVVDGVPAADGANAAPGALETNAHLVQGTAQITGDARCEEGPTVSQAIPPPGAALKSAAASA
jgi:hypothetical protein